MSKKKNKKKLTTKSYHHQQKGILFVLCILPIPDRVLNKFNKVNNDKTKKEYLGNAPPTAREETEQDSFPLPTGV